jgi:hypothetical protein
MIEIAAQLGPQVLQSVKLFEDRMHRLFRIDRSEPVFENMPLYHYTTGDNILNIIKPESTDLWSTHIGCLNDTAEVKYAMERIKNGIEQRKSGAKDARLNSFYDLVSVRLAEPKIEFFDQFVTCFSEIHDDLSQWRAYAGGEAGYAIMLDKQWLERCPLPNTFLIKVEYDSMRQSEIVEDALKTFEEIIANLCPQAGSLNLTIWLSDLADAFLQAASSIAAWIKHPAFKEEREWRLVHTFADEELSKLKFVQRRSAITTHLPLGFTSLHQVTTTKEGLGLPIVGILVGPCRYPTLSAVAVSKLLTQAGYEAPSSFCGVLSSQVPYRTL